MSKVPIKAICIVILIITLIFVGTTGSLVLNTVFEDIRGVTKKESEIIQGSMVIDDLLPVEKHSEAQMIGRSETPSFEPNGREDQDLISSFLPKTEDYLGNIQSKVSSQVSTFDEFSYSWNMTWGDKMTVGNAMAIDDSDNIYIGGMNQTDDMDWEIIISKYWTNGSLQWESAWNNSSNCGCTSVALDSAENVYLTGWNGSSSDILLLKYNKTGVLQWERSWGGGNTDRANDMIINNSDKIYITGYTQSYGAGGQDVCILRYDVNGTLEWEQFEGGSNNDIGEAIAINSLGTIYVAGHTTDIDPVKGDFLLMKFNSSGNLLESPKIWGEDEYDYFHTMVIDTSDNIYLAGMQEDNGNQERYVCRLNSTGTLEWVDRSGSSGIDMYTEMIVDNLENILIVGTTNFPITEEDDCEIYLAKYSSSGVLRYEGFWNDNNSFDMGYDLVLDQSGNLYIVGATGNFTGGTGLFLKFNTNMEPSILIDDTDPARDWDYTSSHNAWCSGFGNASFPFIIEDMTVSGHGVSSSIEIRNSSVYFIVRNCTVIDSGGGSASGIKLVSVTNGEVINNDCSLNNYGIYLSNCHDILISGNTANNNELDGIYLEYCDETTINNNTADFNLYDGFKIIKSTNTDIKGDNKANNNFNNGLTLLFCEDSDIRKDNQFKENFGDGIVINYCNDSLILDRNEIMKNGGHGLNLSYCIDFIINQNNEIIGNNKSGIFIEYCNDDNTISANTVNGNGWDGIFLSDCDGFNTVSYNTVAQNGGKGIVLQNSKDQNTISENTVYQNGHHGISLILINHSFISENLIEENRRDGIHLTDCHNRNYISENTLIENDYRGIFLGLCNESFISKNHIENHKEGIYLILSHQNTISRNFIYVSNKSISILHSQIRIFTGNSGIVLKSSNYNSISGNLVTGDLYNWGKYGLYVISSHFNFIIYSNQIYFVLHGIYVEGCDNRIAGNTLNQCETGIYLNSTYREELDNNSFSEGDVGITFDNATENSVTNSLFNNNTGYAIYITNNSISNRIYYNDFVDNNGGNIQAYDDCGENYWSDESEIGNYWSDHGTGSVYKLDGGVGVTDSGSQANPFGYSSPIPELSGTNPYGPLLVGLAIISVPVAVIIALFIRKREKLSEY